MHLQTVIMSRTKLPDHKAKKTLTYGIRKCDIELLGGEEAVKEFVQEKLDDEIRRALKRAKKEVKE